MESYSKYAWVYIPAWSPMILAEFLLAPTVPSEPRPQNLQDTVSADSVTRGSWTSRLRCVTSSLTPMVNRCFPFSSFMLSNTALIWAGVTSRPARPYRPPYTSGAFSRLASAAQVSRYTAPAMAPGSRDRSMAAIFFTVLGSAFRKYWMSKGRNRWICSNPTFSPRPFR